MPDLHHFKVREFTNLTEEMEQRTETEGLFDRASSS